MKRLDKKPLNMLFNALFSIRGFFSHLHPISAIKWKNIQMKWEYRKCSEKREPVSTGHLKIDYFPVDMKTLQQTLAFI